MTSLNAWLNPKPSVLTTGTKLVLKPKGENPNHAQNLSKCKIDAPYVFYNFRQSQMIKQLKKIA